MVELLRMRNEPPNYCLMILQGHVNGKRVMQASTFALKLKRARQFVKRQASRARLPFIIHHSSFVHLQLCHAGL